MPKLPIIDSLRRKVKRSSSSSRTTPAYAIGIGEGEEVVLTYTSAVDKMKVFSAFIREGLENGDLVDYSYPDEESETIRARLEEYGIDVEKYERKGALRLRSLTEYYLPDGKFDKDELIKKGFNERANYKKRGNNHLRDLEDLGDFSFLNGQWQTYVDYWDDPRWETPSGSSVEILDYSPFVIELIAFDVEHIDQVQLTEMLKAFWVGSSYTLFIDLLEHKDAFSKLLGTSHKKLIGYKALLEFDPVSNYEKIVERMARESMANVEPIFVFTSNRSPIHTYLAKQSTINFFLTSISTSNPKSTSKNTVLLPAKNAPLILDAVNKVKETHKDTNVCFVFDILSELLTTIGREKTFTFLRYALDLLSSEKATSLFLLNPSAHASEVVSSTRSLFSNQLAYGKDGLQIVKAL